MPAADDPPAVSDLIDSIAIEAVTIQQTSKRTRGFQQFSTPADATYPSPTKQLGDKDINQYCNDLHLDVPGRLKLFIQVCAAIHSAHQHAVLHGNLRPDSIIVTAEGVPRVLNFGASTSVHPEHSNDDGAAIVDLTKAPPGQSVLTPEYLSPEQVKGEPVTTASDVYSLGILLYDLLAGRWPYHVTSMDRSDLLQAICEQLPEKPSHAVSAQPGEAVLALASTSDLSLPAPDNVASARGVSPRRLKGILRGDLDSIVLMALQKEPERRYSSVAHLSEDLARYLRRIPVHARRHFPAYRSSRFIRRHGLAIAAGCLSLLVFLTASIALTRAFVTARRQRDQTEQAFGQARRVLEQTLTQISDDRLLNQRAFAPLRQTLLQNAQGFYEDYLRQRSTEPKLEADQAFAQTCLAKILSLTGSKPKAIVEYHQAVALWDKLLTKEPENLEYQARLAQTLNELGLILLPLTDRLDETLSTFLRAQAMHEHLVEAHPELPLHSLQLGISLLNIAEIKDRQAKTDEAIGLVEDVVKIDSQLSAERPELLEPRIALATAYATLGRLWAQDPAELPAAIASYEHAIDLREAVTRQQPQLADQVYLLAVELNKLSGLREALGLSDPAVQSLHRALQIYERVASLCPQVSLYQEELGTTYIRMSEMERKHGDQAEALALADKAQSLFARLAADNPDNVSYRQALAQSYNSLGRIQSQRAEIPAALRSFQRAIDLYESLLQLSSHDSYKLACNIALCIPLITKKNAIQSTSQELTKGDRLRWQLYGDRAIESLRRSFKGGFLNSQILQDDTDLDAIRTRPDFKALLKEIEEMPTTNLK